MKNKLIYSNPVIRNRKGYVEKDWYVEYYSYNIATEEKRRHQIKSNKKLNQEFGGPGNTITNLKEKRRYFRELLSLIINELEHKNSNNMRKLSIKDAMEVAIEIKKDEVTPRSMRTYRFRAKDFVRWCKKRKQETADIRSVSSKFVQQYINANTSSKEVKRQLSTLFTALEKEQIISSNPCRKAQVKKGLLLEPTRHKLYTDEQARAIFEAVKINAELNIAALLLYYCMMRPVEITRLRRDNFNLVDKTISITPRINHKSKRTRILPINTKIISALEAIQGDYITKKQNRDNYFSNLFRPIKQQLELDDSYSFYGLKHKGACKLYQATKDIMLVMNYCGHASVNTTIRYVLS